MEQQSPSGEESIFDESDFSMKGYDKHVRNARIMLYILSGLVLVALYTIFPLGDDLITWGLLGLGILISAVFGFSAYWSKKKPYTALLTALIFFCLLQLLSGILQPASLLSGWYIRIAVFLFLILGVRNGKQIQDMQKTFGNNL